jgi:enoyl-CoA hydratase/carnithine racemase
MVMPMSEFLLFEQDGPIVTLTMNQPQVRNALTGNTAVAEFEAACRRIEEDHSISAVILTGAGTVFSSGGNIHEMERQLGSHIEPAHLRHEYREGIQRLPKALYNLEVPTIAAVNGPAIGAGCDLACMCDIRIAADTARFAESFVKLGIIPGDGGAWLLPRAIGMSRAAELTFTGDIISAQQALEWGLVSRVVPAAELMQAARELAGRIAQNSGPALRMSKRLLREGQHTRLDSLLEMSAGFQAIAHRTREHTEAVQGFVAKAAAKNR